MFTPSKVLSKKTFEISFKDTSKLLEIMRQLRQRSQNTYHISTPVFPQSNVKIRYI